MEHGSSVKVMGRDTCLSTGKCPNQISSYTKLTIHFARSMYYQNYGTFNLLEKKRATASPE